MLIELFSNSNDPPLAHTVHHCSYFHDIALPDVRACRCAQDASARCVPEREERTAHSPLVNTVKAAVSFLAIVLCCYVGKLLLQQLLALVAGGCDRCDSCKAARLVPRAESSGLFESSTSVDGRENGGDGVKLVQKSASTEAATMV